MNTGIKRIVSILTVLLFLPGMLLAGCGKNTKEKTRYEIIDGKIVEVRPDENVIHDGYDASASLPGETEKVDVEITDGIAWQKEEYNSLSEGDPAIERLKARLLTVCDAARESYLAAEKGSTMNVTLSATSLASMLASIGSAGYPAQDSKGSLNMQSYPVLDAFAHTASETTEDTEGNYFIVYPEFNYFYRIIFNYL